MDTSQWPQGIVVKPMEEIVPKNTNTRKIRPHHHQQQIEQSLKKSCPRCNSINTKFCYYNNYSLSQPRFYCKTCRRYWTDGGSLRNIPIGGLSRKSKKSSSKNIIKNNIINIFPTKVIQDPPPDHNKEVQDLNLDFSSDFKIIQQQQSSEVPRMECEEDKIYADFTLSFEKIEKLIPKDDFKIISELIQVPNVCDHPNSSIYSSLDLFSTSLDHGYECNNNIIQDLQESITTTTTTTSGGILFPFEDLKQVTNTGESSSTGYWNAILGGNINGDLGD